jgi:predicted nucleic acid-binding protein
MTHQTLAEAAAVFARAVCMKSMTQQIGEEVSHLLNNQWPYYLKTSITEKTVARAAELARILGLRGYDAVHLASAEWWQSALGAPVNLVTYDRQLAEGGGSSG